MCMRVHAHVCVCVCVCVCVRRCECVCLLYVQFMRDVCKLNRVGLDYQPEPLSCARLRPLSCHTPHTPPRGRHPTASALGAGQTGNS
jgi:hypothetical protein